MPASLPTAESRLDPPSGFKIVNLSDLCASPHNARKHTNAQIQALARSIDAFGFAAPILADKHSNILAGHARFKAAELLGLTQLPVVFLDHLTEIQAKAYMLADNKLTDRSTWDEPKLAVQLKALSDLALEFDIEATGFEAPEIDFRIQSLEKDTGDDDENLHLSTGPAVSELGDVWSLGDHKIYCGDALGEVSYATLMTDIQASAVFTDPPYNVNIEGHVSGKGKV